MQLAKSSLVGKAAARPDLVRRVLVNVKKEGLRPTFDKVFAKLDTPIPLGYSLVGEVIGVGRDVAGFSLGDRVACAGAGLANHAEINAVPKNLCVRVPAGRGRRGRELRHARRHRPAGRAAGRADARRDGRGDGPRPHRAADRADPQGQRLPGASASIPTPARAALAKQLGADIAVSEALSEIALARTGGHGADAVIVTASSKSSEPINQAAEISRVKGRIVVVGLVGMTIDREPFYKRELDLKLSMSYGPGRDDPAYEFAGHDYPLPYVRWTEQRNMEAFSASSTGPRDAESLRHASVRDRGRREGLRADGEGRAASGDAADLSGAAPAPERALTRDARRRATSSASPSSAWAITRAAVCCRR